MEFLEYLKDHKIAFISLALNGLLIISCSFLIYRYFNYECFTNDNAISNEALGYNCDVVNVSDELSRKASEFYVEVKGAVNKPGVYKVTSDNIINDVITMANGFTKSAYTNNINLSKKVKAEMVIYVYTSEEYDAKNKTCLNIDDPCLCQDYDISDCTSDKKSEIVTAEDSKNSENNCDSNGNTQNENSDSNSITTTNSKININTASKKELTNLSGIGDAKAEKIISYRNEHGLFKSIDELKKVSGIGEAIFEKIKDNITI